MDIFFESMVCMLLVAVVILNFVVIHHVDLVQAFQKRMLESEIHYEEKLLSAIDSNCDRIIEINQTLSNISAQIDRSMLAQRDALEPTKPIKSNNWDSIREAFKGPTRIDLNDRD